MTAIDMRLVRFKQLRDKAFENNDVDFFMRNMPEGADPETLILAYHKARYSCTTVSEKTRRASAKWLKEKGYPGLHGLVVVGPDEPLPE